MKDRDLSPVLVATTPGVRPEDVLSALRASGRNPAAGRELGQKMEEIDRRALSRLDGRSPWTTSRGLTSLTPSFRASVLSEIAGAHDLAPPGSVVFAPATFCITRGLWASVLDRHDLVVSIGPPGAVGEAVGLPAEASFAVWELSALRLLHLLFERRGIGFWTPAGTDSPPPWISALEAGTGGTLLPAVDRGDDLEARDLPLTVRQVALLRDLRRGRIPHPLPRLSEPSREILEILERRKEAPTGASERSSRRPDPAPRIERLERRARTLPARRSELDKKKRRLRNLEGDLRHLERRTRDLSDESRQVLAKKQHAEKVLRTLETSWTGRLAWTLSAAAALFRLRRPERLPYPPSWWRARGSDEEARPAADSTAPTDRSGRSAPGASTGGDRPGKSAAPGSPESVESAGDGSTRPESVDIIVCIHDALDDVRRCLDSILHGTRLPYRVILVDDGSNLETKAYLRDQAAVHDHFRLIESESATGYTRAANRGLRKSTAELVVLLNSDTVVPAGWLDGLRECFASSSRIGIAGPLSNAATWQSVPQRVSPEGDWAINPLPPGWDVDRMAREVGRLSERRYPRVGFVNGFCLAIRKEVLDKIGEFDEEAFPKGYGEENDFCLRTAAAGFELAIADQTWVYHAKSRSYGDERRNELSRLGGRALERIHGKQTIDRHLEKTKESPELEALRERIAEALPSPHASRTEIPSDPERLKILFLLPVDGGGGGVHAVVEDAAGLVSIGSDTRIAVPRVHRPGFLARYPDFPADLFLGFEPHELSGIAAEYDVAIATIFTSVKILADLVEDHRELLPAYYIQDYEPWFVAGTDLEAEALASYDRIPGMVRFAKSRWICRQIRERHGLGVELVAPALDTSVYHPPTRPEPEDPERPVRITAMIRPRTPRRGAPRTMRVLRQIRRELGEKAEVVIFGCDPDDPQFQELATDFEHRHLGMLERWEVPPLLRSCDVFLDFSTFQAFGRTGLEAMACDCCAVVPAEGGTDEYAVHRENALVVDTTDEAALLEAVRELVLDADLRRRLRAAGLETAFRFSLARAAASELEVLRRALRERRSTTTEDGIP